MSDGSLSQEEIDAMLGNTDTSKSKTKARTGGTEVLSQDEIDQLLAAIASGEVEAEEADTNVSGVKIKMYDFKRPDKFNMAHIHNISVIHEMFAMLSSDHLSAWLRSFAQVHVASVDQLTCEEFIRSIPNPTTLAVISMAPLKGFAAMEIDPAVTFALIDSLLGGHREQCKLSRELTVLEKAIMESVIVRLLEMLRESWKPVIDLVPGLVRIYSNPALTAIVPPHEKLVLVTLETRVGQVEGVMNICIPHTTIAPLLPWLSSAYPKSVSKENADAQFTAAKELLARQTAVTRYKEYVAGCFALEDIAKWKKGSSFAVLAESRGTALYETAPKARGAENE